MSLAGVQPKLVLVRDASGRFGLPTAAVPSTHILKPPALASDGLPRYEDVVANELFCLRVLRETGIPAARAEVLPIAAGEALLVTRYDRSIGRDGRIARVHQEDLCQALGKISSQKYEEERGGVRLTEIFEILDRATAVPARTRLDLFDRVVASFVLGNADLHAKNLAVIHGEPQGRLVDLAPMYDVLCTAAYPELSRRMAMSLGDAVKLEDVTGDSFLALARGIGMGTQAPRRARDVARRVVGSAEAMRAAATESGWHRPVLDAIVDGARARLAQLA